MKNTVKITRPAEDFHRLVPDSATNPTKWKLYFYLQSTTSSCANLTATQQTKTRLQFWEFGPDSGDVSDLITACGGDHGACPIMLNPYWNPGSPSWAGGHTDYRFGRIVMRQANLATQEAYETTISHEVGHAFGLSECLNATGEPCNQDSIMHSSQDYDFPTTKDRRTVIDDVVPRAAGSGTGSDAGEGGDIND